MKYLSRRRSIGGLAAATAVLSLAMAPAATADPVPFTDPSVSGYIGFCDSSGHQIRSGKIGAAPFVVRAVSSAPVPSGFTKATLFLYQPRKEHDPGEWTGKQMTAASTFTNPQHPMVAGTGLDPAFVDFSSVQPLTWDSLAQARLYYSTPGRPVHVRPYPAAVLRLSGDTWTQVGEGDVPCNAGTAQSAELQALPPSILKQTNARSTPGVTPTPSGPSGAPGSRAGGKSGSGAAAASSSATGTTGTTGTTGASGTGAPSTSTHPVANASSSTSSGTGAAVWITLALIAAAVAAVVAYLGIRRRRRVAHSIG